MYLRSFRDALILAIFSSSAFAGNLPGRAIQVPPTCLMPLNSGDPDPSVRDVHFVIAGDKKSVSASMCIVSNEKRPLSYFEAFVGFFQDNGAFIEDVGNIYHNIQPLSGTTQGQPSIVLLFSQSVTIDPKYSDHLLNGTIVQATWAFCLAPAPSPCVNDTVKTGSFLLPVSFDQLTSKAKTRR